MFAHLLSAPAGDLAGAAAAGASASAARHAGLLAAIAAEHPDTDLENKAGDAL